MNDGPTIRFQNQKHQLSVYPPQSYNPLLVSVLMGPDYQYRNSHYGTQYNLLTWFPHQVPETEIPLNLPPHSQYQMPCF